jgi:hypothetical protein
MSRADDDAQKWMEANSKWQYRNWVNATETGKPYYIDQNGTVIIEKPKAKEGEEK